MNSTISGQWAENSFPEHPPSSGHLVSQARRFYPQASGGDRLRRVVEGERCVSTLYHRR